MAYVMFLYWKLAAIASVLGAVFAEKKDSL
jgi:hypothetical protein